MSVRKVGSKFIERYSNGELKALLTEAWQTEVQERAIELGRPLTTEEAQAIIITDDFVRRWSKRGKLPASSTLHYHFGSLIHAAQVAGLPTGRKKARRLFDPTEKSLYIAKVREWSVAFDRANGRAPTRSEVVEAIQANDIDEVPTTVMSHVERGALFEQIGIKATRRGGSKRTLSDDDLIAAVRSAHESKCLVHGDPSGRDRTADQTPEVSLSLSDYVAFRNRNQRSLPSVVTISRRLGPHWDAVLKRAGLP